MNICVYKNDYFKESSDIKRAIVCGVRSLYERIALYENQNVPFERIFNDERVKYDKHGDFYTFKCKKSDVQLRILYTYIVIDDTPVIVIADFFVKKKNNKKYIKQFENAKYLDPYVVYKNSKCIMSC